jgi:hypothetical protein
MKFLLVSVICLSTFANAQTRREFDENLEKKCFKELTAIGCVNKGEEVKGCAEVNKKRLSVSCQSLVDDRKKTL